MLKKLAFGSTDKNRRLQVVLAGPRGRGKSAVFATYAGGRSSGVGGGPAPPSDVIEMARTVVTVAGSQIQIMLWELTGLQRHYDTETTYLAIGHVFIMAYDRDSRESFEALKNKWLPSLKQRCMNKRAVMCLLACPGFNQSEAATSEVPVSKEEGVELAEAHNMMFEETSLSSSEVEELIYRLVRTAAVNHQMFSAAAMKANPALLASASAALTPGGSVSSFTFASRPAQRQVAVQDSLTQKDAVNSDRSAASPPVPDDSAALLRAPPASEPGSVISKSKDTTPRSGEERDSATEEAAVMPLHKAILAHAGRAHVTHLIDSFPASLHESMADGRTALHVACAAACAAGPEDGGGERHPSPREDVGLSEEDAARIAEHSKQQLAAWEAVVDLLLERFPEACACRDAERNLPVHVALTSKMPTAQLRACVDKLLMVYPEAAMMEPLLLKTAIQRKDVSVDVLLAILECHPEAASQIHIEDQHLLVFAIKNRVPAEVTVALLAAAKRHAEHLCSQKQRESLLVTAFKMEADPRVIVELLKIKPRFFLTDFHDRSRTATAFDWILHRQVYPLAEAPRPTLPLDPPAAAPEASSASPEAACWPLSPAFCVSVQGAVLRACPELKDCFKRTLAGAAKSLFCKSALHLAAETGDLELVTQLCAAHPADLLKFDSNGLVPMLVAANAHGSKHECSAMLEQLTRTHSLHGRYLPRRSGGAQECSPGMLVDGEHALELAFDLKSQRNVVLKYYETRLEWQHEAGVLSRLATKGGLHVGNLLDSFKLETGPEESLSSASLRYCNALEAGTRCLTDILGPHKVVDGEARRALVVRVLQSLAHLQSKKMVHGSLTPSSVTVDAQNRVFLRSFLACKQTGEAVDAPKHPECCAPEIAAWAMRETKAASPATRPGSVTAPAKPPRADPAQDMWALGCLVFEMEVGVRLFPGTSREEVLQQVASWPLSEAEAESRLADVRAVNPGAFRVVKALLHKDPKERATLKQVLALAYVKDGLRVQSPVIPGAQALAVSRQIELQKTVGRQMQALLAASDGILPPLLLLLPGESARCATPRSPVPGAGKALDVLGDQQVEMGHALRTATMFRLVFMCQANTQGVCMCSQHMGYEIGDVSKLLRSAAPVFSVVATSLMSMSMAAEHSSAGAHEVVPDRSRLEALCLFYDKALAARIREMQQLAKEDPGADLLTGLGEDPPPGATLERALSKWSPWDLFSPAYAALAEVSRQLKINARSGQVGYLQRVVHKASGDFHWVCHQHAAEEAYLSMTELNSHPSAEDVRSVTPTPYGSVATSVQGSSVYPTPVASPSRSRYQTPLVTPRSSNSAQLSRHTSQGGSPTRTSTGHRLNRLSNRASARPSAHAPTDALTPPPPPPSPPPLALKLTLPPLPLGMLGHAPTPVLSETSVERHNSNRSDATGIMTNLSSTSSDNSSRSVSPVAKEEPLSHPKIEAMMSSKLHTLERSMEDHFKQLQHQIRDLAVSRASDIPPAMAALPTSPNGEAPNLQSAAAQAGPVTLQAKLAYTSSTHSLTADSVSFLAMCDGHEIKLLLSPFTLTFTIAKPSMAVLYIEVKRSKPSKSFLGQGSRSTVSLGQIMLPISSLMKGSGRMQSSHVLRKVPDGGSCEGGLLLLEYTLE